MSMKMTNTQPRWASLKDAASVAGISARHLAKLVECGAVEASHIRLPGKNKGKILVNIASLESYIVSYALKQDKGSTEHAFSK